MRALCSQKTKVHGALSGAKAINEQSRLMTSSSKVTDQAKRKQVQSSSNKARSFSQNSSADMASKRITIILLIATWRRYRVARLMYEGVERLQKFCLSANVELVPVVIFSEKHHELEAAARGWEAVYAENTQLGLKMNEGYRYLKARGGFDFVMQLGADDLMTNEGMAKCVTLMRKGCELAGFTRLYVCKFSTKQVRTAAAGVTPFGAGRWMSARVFLEAGTRVLVKLDREEDEGLRKVYGDEVWMPVRRAEAQKRRARRIKEGLWTDEQQRGLDGDSMERIMDTGVSMTIMDGYHIIDIKDEMSLNAFRLFEQGGEEVAFVSLLSRFPELRMI